MTKKRTHIPAVPAEKLPTVLRAVDLLPVNKRAKRAIQDMLVEASLPNRTDPDRLDPVRAMHIREARAELAELTTKTVSRASASLRNLSDDDWDFLVNAADGED